MPEQVKTPALTKPEKFEINASSTGITEADGEGTNWKDIWDYKVQTNQFIEIGPDSIFSTSLVGDDAAAMPNATRIKVVRRDVSNEDEKALLTEVSYKQAQEFQDKKKLMRFRGLLGPMMLGEGEHIVVRIAGADATGTGDTDASASYFKIICQRRKKALG